MNNNNELVAYKNNNYFMLSVAKFDIFLDKCAKKNIFIDSKDPEEALDIENFRHAFIEQIDGKNWYLTIATYNNDDLDAEDYEDDYHLDLYKIESIILTTNDEVVYMGNLMTLLKSHSLYYFTRLYGKSHIFHVQLDNYEIKHIMDIFDIDIKKSFNIIESMELNKDELVAVI